MTGSDLLWCALCLFALWAFLRVAHIARRVRFVSLGVSALLNALVLLNGDVIRVWAQLSTAHTFGALLLAGATAWCSCSAVLWLADWLARRSS